MSRLITKPTKWPVRPAKTQISLGICPVWSESSLSAWRKLGFLATHWAHCKDSDQTGRMPRLIGVFAGRTLILLVLSCRCSIMFVKETNQISSWKSAKLHAFLTKGAYSNINRLCQTESAVFKLWMLYFRRIPFSDYLEITTAVVVPCGSCKTFPRTST